MTRPTSRAALRIPEGERLPWLSEKPRRHSRSSTVEVAGWIAASLIVLAGGSYWAGIRSVAPRVAQVPTPASREVSVSLPEVRGAVAAAVDEGAPSAPQEQDVTATSAAVEPAVRPTALARPKSTPPARAATAGAKEQTPMAPDPHTLWPTDKIEGAGGRLVRIGSFESEAGARESWDKILSAYPGMARLKPLVVSGKSLRDGRTFYRVHVGTSSQAHSEVVCQRSRGLELGCSVVGLIVSEGE